MQVSYNHNVNEEELLLNYYYEYKHLTRSKIICCLNNVSKLQASIKTESYEQFVRI